MSIGIVDFSVPDDTIRLENAVFTAFAATGPLAAAAVHTGTAAADASDRVIYDAPVGLSSDSDGTGAALAVKFAQLATGLALTHADSCDHLMRHC